MKNKIEFEPGLYYHEVLKANSDGILFKDTEDRKFFLKMRISFLLVTRPKLTPFYRTLPI
jgi:hypothetical protein